MADSVPADQVRKIVFACEAGMGTSLLGATQLKKKLKQAGLNVEVANSPVHTIPQDAQVVLAHKMLASLARERAPWAVVISFDNFVGNPAYDRIVQALRDNADIIPSR